MNKNLVTIMTFSDELEARVCQGQLQVDLVNKKKAEELLTIKS